MKKEEQNVGKVKATAGYIVSFYEDLEAFNVYVAQYIDMSVRLGEKYENSDDIAILETEKEELVTLTKTIRTLAFRLNIKAKAMAKKIKEFEDALKDLKKIYDKIIEQASFKREDLEKFALVLNEAFMEGISYDTLGQLADIYSAMSSAMVDMSSGGMGFEPGEA
jgi:hypothetical protein